MYMRRVLDATSSPSNNLKRILQCVLQSYRAAMKFNPHLAIVDTNNTANHFGNNDHVTKVCLDHSRLLIGGSLFLSLTELLDETHWTALETALEPTASTGVNELDAKLNAIKLMYQEYWTYFNKL